MIFLYVSKTGIIPLYQSASVNWWTELLWNFWLFIKNNNLVIHLQYAKTNNIYKWMCTIKLNNKSSTTLQKYGRLYERKENEDKNMKTDKIK